jgi:hypothetical protein
MADGTTKNIEDVVYGDMIKSWDRTNKCYIDVKTYGALPTGRARAWKRHFFSDKSFLDIYDTHPVYNIRVGYPLNTRDWKLGDAGRGLDGALIRLQSVVDYTDEEYTPKYTLMSENSLYFANGVLCGHIPNFKWRVYQAGLLPQATEEDVAAFKAGSSAYEEEKNRVISNIDYNLEVAPYEQKLATFKRNIALYKEKLAGVDYKNIKYSQGQLTEEEYQEYLAYCTKKRAQINETEALCEECKAKIKEIQEKHHIADKPSWKSLFNKACAREMAVSRSQPLE